MLEVLRKQPDLLVKRFLHSGGSSTVVSFGPPSVEPLHRERAAGLAFLVCLLLVPLREASI